MTKSKFKKSVVTSFQCHYYVTEWRHQNNVIRFFQVLTYTQQDLIL